jgi:eukaryotic-like serine/threonine-protein kinase
MSAKEWPTLQGNPARTGEAQEVITPPLEKAWEFEAAGFIVHAPAISDGLIFFGDGTRAQKGTFYALDVFSGRLVWKFETGGIINSSPTVSNGTVYFGSRDMNFYALDMKNGKLNWKFRCEKDENPMMPGRFSSSPLIVNDVVCVTENVLYLLNAKNGKEIAREEFTEWTGANPAFCDGILFSGSRKEVRAYNWSSKKKIWNVKLPGKTSSGPSVSKNVVFVGTSYDTLHALQAKTGQQLWEFQIENDPIHSFPILSSPAISKERVIFGAPDGWVYALNVEDGKKKWAFNTGGCVLSNPVVSGSVVYIISENEFYALDLEKGQPLWKNDCGSSRGSSPAICNNMVFVGSGLKMFALRK